MTTVALHIIAKDELKELKNIINLYHQYFDAIDIAIDDEHTLDMLKLFVEKTEYKVNLYHYKWNDEEKKRGYPSFDDKRNFLTSKCTQDFYLRLDTDDEIMQPELVREIVERAAEKRIEIVSCYYDYSRDQFGNTHAAHYRETIVKNSDRYRWNKHIHENIIPVNPREKVNIVIDKTLCIKHNIDYEHAEKSRDRNLKFLLEEYEATKDNPDSRTLAYLGRMLYPMGHLKEAKFFLEKHIQTSGWDEDRYVSWCYLAGVMEDAGELDQAFACCYEALNERPDFPDAYLVMHKLYFAKGDWAKAVHWGKIGLSTKRPDTFMLIDPASYTWRPAVTMAHCFLMLGEVDKARQFFQIVKKTAPGLDWVANNEKLFDDAVVHKGYVERFAWLLQFLKERDKDKIPEMFDIVPKELEKHELLVRLKHHNTKPKVWDDNEIAIYCGQSWEDWAAPSVLKGIGGSEEAVIYLSGELSKLGHKVTVYCSCGDLAGTYNGVTYKEYFEFNPFDSYNTVILWRGNVYKGINAKRKIVWLHDVPYNLFPEDEINTYDRIIVLSEYHKSLLPDYIPDGKIYVSTNGINVKDFNLKDEPKRDPKRIIYTSSYDRGIGNLLEMWGDVKKEVPEAELHLFYGWEVYDEMLKKGFRDPEFKRKMMKLIIQPGVFDHGRVNHKKLIKEFYKAGIYAYPSHFEEISCISAMKAQACGCVPVTTDYAALKETVKEGIKIPGKAGEDGVNEKFKEELISLLKDPERQEGLRNTLKSLRDGFSWAKVAQGWHNDLLTKDLQHQQFKSLEDYRNEYNQDDDYTPPNFNSDGKPINIHRFGGTLEICKEYNAKTLLDIGSADGALCFLASDMGVKSDGVEIGQKGVEFAREYAEKNGYDCQFFCGAFEEFQTDKKYDIVSVQEVIEHVIDPKAFLEKVNKIAKYVYITTPHKEGAFGIRNRDPHHIHHFDEDSLRELIGDKKIHHLQSILQGEILVAIYENQS